MKDSLHSYMKVGIVHPMAFPEGVLIETLKVIVEDEFFGGIEIKSVPEDSRDEVSKLLATSRLEVGYVGQVTILAEKLDIPRDRRISWINQNDLRRPPPTIGKMWKIDDVRGR